jgi:A/G-specific adenine glycosylase
MPSLKKFQKIIYDHFKKNGRSFPWRETRDPYKILVSEIMLQQTQAPRVVEKYNSFLKRFPAAEKLAHASDKAVLKEWQGLGYNRRSLNLKKAAEIVVTDYRGNFPKDYETLLTLPGVGPATAGDLLAFVWNKPMIVIETNIRSVFIHFFFSDQKKISDNELLPLIKKTLDKKNPRNWYYALMDYGAYLKKTLPNPNRQSRHYTKQTAFRGSNRELRSKILKYILAYPKQPQTIIAASLDLPEEHIQNNLITMTKEGLIKEKKVKNIKVFYI